MDEPGNGRFSATFAHGLEGYTDDRLADGVGWVTFDVTSIRCPVTVLHGGSDRIVDVIHAHHTAEVVPGAKLVIFDYDGHFQHRDQSRARDPQPFAALAQICSARQRTRWRPDLPSLGPTGGRCSAASKATRSRHNPRSGTLGRLTHQNRRYLKPIFGCLRRNRRGVFAAAVTRYLKPVYAAEPADIEDSARRQILAA